MVDNVTAVSFVDGAGITRQQNSTNDNSGFIAPQTALRTNGAPVEAGNPLPVTMTGGPTVAGQASALVQSTAAAAALGTPADAVWSGSGAGSVVGALKAIWTALTVGIGIKPAAITITQTVVPLTQADNPIVAANPNRKYLAIINIGTGLASLGFGAVAVAGQGWPLSAASVAGDGGGGLERSGDGITLQAIHGICAIGVTTSVVVLEGV